MTVLSILWAQPLDNRAPDHVEKKGRLLDPRTDAAHREAAVSSVAGVIKHGAVAYSREHIKLTEDRGRFVIELPSAQRDERGRIAPIVGLGELPPTIDDGFGSTVAIELEEFARRIGRTVEPEHMSDVRAAFAEQKKKRSAAKKKRLAGGALLFLLFMALVLLSRASCGSAGT